MKWMVLLGLALFARNAVALDVGSPAPDIAVPSTSGSDVKLSDFKGKWVVLYFFPKAFTPGCTAESCSLRDSNEEIQKHGAVVLGVSLDDVARQKDFKKEHKMPFELLGDSDKKLAKAFDVLAMGGLFTQRKTFIINPEGKIAYIFDSVNPAQHSTQVLTVLENLQKK